MPVITYRDLAMLSPRAAPFNRPGWIFELKYDGFRVLADRREGRPRLMSRRGNDLIACYPEISAALLELPEMVMDGELVVLDAHGKSRFEPLRRRLALKRRVSIEHAARTTPAAIFAFDSLELRGKDMRIASLTAGSAFPQSVGAGPYYATPSWDQQLRCDSPATCPRYWADKLGVSREELRKAV